MRPACGNEWISGICGKPKVKCGECPNQDFLRITDEVIDGHLRGRQTIGVYPMLTDGACWFLAADFDKQTWQRDAQARKRQFKHRVILRPTEFQLSAEIGEKHIPVQRIYTALSVDEKRNTLIFDSVVVLQVYLFAAIHLPILELYQIFKEYLKECTFQILREMC